MKTWICDKDFTLYQGDAYATLATFEDNSIDCVVTSPPYYGLRDYGTGTWEGGDPGCGHKQGRDGAGRADGKVDGRGQRNRDGVAALTKQTCRCGAVRIDHQIGLEPSLHAYIGRMLGLFSQIRRVLKKDGTVWLNLGDSYATQPGKGDNVPQTKHPKNTYPEGAPHRAQPQDGVKPKDLMGVPWRVALALQDDGWYLRSDIIWAKPNPMPESITDRPTKAHEYIFLLTKSRSYFFDQDAVREPYNVGAGPSVAGWAEGPGSHSPIDHARAKGPDGRKYTKVKAQDGSIQHRDGERWPNPEGRNIRTVWTVPSQPYPDAHFATFPERIPELCIKAGCPENGTVLDPFMGSGTTAVVARRLGRKCIGVELSEEYCELIAKRTEQLSLLA